MNTSKLDFAQLKQIIEEERDQWVKKVEDPTYVKRRVKRTLEESFDRLMLSVLGITKRPNAGRDGMNEYHLDQNRARGWFAECETRARDYLQKKSLEWIETPEAKAILDKLIQEHVEGVLRRVVSAQISYYRDSLTSQVSFKLRERVSKDMETVVAKLIPDNQEFLGYDEAMAALTELETDMAKDALLMTKKELTAR